MIEVRLLDLINGISGALDFVSATVTGHHRRVGIALSSLAEHLELSQEDSTDLIMAGLLHDIGAFSLDLKPDGLDFDADLTEHASMGYRLLRGYPLLNHPAWIVKYHHTPWYELESNPDNVDERTLLLGNYLNLIDRVDILSKVGSHVFDRDNIRKVIGDYSLSFYSKDGIEAFMEISASSEFWDRMDNTEAPIKTMVGSCFIDKLIPEEQLLDFSLFFSHVIDFRSRHTATHSQGVAETAIQLAKMAGMDELDQRRIRLAGNLHDIGKLAVPLPLLDKPGPLDPKEFVAVRQHAIVCESVLNSIPGMESLANWACQHHERLNGRGYPHNLPEEKLSLGSRILAVADVYTAITEDRPYRSGMESGEARSVLRTLANSGSLDPDIVALVLDNYEHLDAVRAIVQTRAFDEFKRFRLAG